MTGKRRFSEKAGFLLFAGYCFVILWVTIASRIPTTRRYELGLFWALRELINGSPDGVKNVVQYINNILFFIPFGFLFPWKKKGWLLVTSAAFFVSVGIELSQFIFCLGLAEVDDVVSNTIGASIGAAFYKKYKIGLRK